jgi:DNA-binding response OmpR family regulator
MKDKTILICDDDESVLETLSMVLTSFGFTVIQEKKSINIFSMLDHKKPDILLVDLRMPTLTGDDVIKKVKSNSATSNIPVILISASPEAKIVAEETGADGFLAKPFHLQELIGTIESKLAVA